MRNTPSARAVSRRSGKSLRPLHCRAGRFLRIPNCERPAAFFLCFFGMRRAVFYINFRENTHTGRKSAPTAVLYAHQEKFCARRGSALAALTAAQPPCKVCAFCRAIKIITSAGTECLRRSSIRGILKIRPGPRRGGG